MKVPVSWLREYCDPDWSVEHLAERLAMTGTEVERVGIAGASSADGYVVGYVDRVEPHPDADRLRVCTVDTGDGPRTIVCGAPNVAAGQHVPVALPGAVLPDGQELKKAKLRGVESDGMILSETELQIGEDSGGIAVLPGPDDGGAGAGTALGEVLPVAERVLELEVTSNRSDCLAVYGVAREVHAISDAALAEAPWSVDAEAAGEGEASDYASVSVEAPELCPRFTARVFTDVEIGPSPLWLKARLAAAGQRPINNVVDVTNYVMLLTGQPLHAFDLDEVPGGELIVRTANQGEKMTTLDGTSEPSTPMRSWSATAKGPRASPGSWAARPRRSRTRRPASCSRPPPGTASTSSAPRASSACAQRHRAASRSNCIPPWRCAPSAWPRSCSSTSSARSSCPARSTSPPASPSPRVVELRVPRVERLVGLEIDVETCAERLERLGFGVETDGDVIRATVPPERAEDVSREADLIEEVARLADLETQLPSTLPATRERVGRLSAVQHLRRRAEDALRGLGADEIVGWSFTDPGIADRLRLAEGDPRRELVELANPLSSEQSVMRPTLIGSLLDAAMLNLARGAGRVALFESAHVYLRQPPDGAEPSGEFGGGFSGEYRAPAYEPHRLGYLAAGEPAASWRDAAAAPDFFTAKGVLESLAAQLGAAVEVEAAEQPFLHPGRSARVFVSKPGDGDVRSAAGWIGELHPLVAREWDLDGGAAFELDLAALISAATLGTERYEDVTTFPSVHQDVAVVVSDDVSAAQVRDAVIAGGGELLASAEVFDVYRGDQAGEGNKSLALRLSFRAPDRTLTEEEVSARREQIRAAVSEIGGSLRE